MTLTPIEIAERRAAGQTNVQIAEELGVNEATIRRWARKPTAPFIKREDGDLVVAAQGEDEIRLLIRENGLNPDDYIIVSMRVGKWGKDGEEQRSTFATLRLKPELALPSYAEYTGPSLRVNIVHASLTEPQRIIIEGDHHAPYQEQALDMLLTRAHHDLRPQRQVFLGDLGDYPTISKHKDHPAAMAGPSECVQESHYILRARREAWTAPEADLLWGNHDWRPIAEILARAERLYDFRCADIGDGIREPLWSLERALRLEQLGIQLHTHPLGWEHAEITLIEDGPNGPLKVRHGFKHGANTARRTVEAMGASVIVGHSHNRETTHVWDAFTQRHYQGLVLGVCCMTDKRFGHYSPENGWAQGAAVVEVWPDGRFTAEHMYYDAGVLTWRDKRWEI